MTKGNFSNSFFLSVNFEKKFSKIYNKRWVHFWEIQFQGYTTLYQNLWQQRKMYLQKDWKAYLKLLLYCTAELWIIRAWTVEIGRHWRKRGRRKSERATTRWCEQYDTVSNMKLVYEKKRVKEFRVTGSLNGANTGMVMANIPPYIEMRAKVIYSFKSEIHWGAEEIVNYSKALTSPRDMFTSLEEIQADIEECKQKRLDLENVEVWSKTYVPITRTIETQGSYQNKVFFKHVQIRLVASNAPLMGCRPLPYWLRNKRCIYAVETFDDKLYVWRCLAIYNRHIRGEQNQVQKKTVKQP